MTISDERLAEMLAACEGLPAGPWEHTTNPDLPHRHFVTTVRRHEAQREDVCEPSNKDPDKRARHLANCDPQTIAALISEVQSARNPSQSFSNWMNQGPALALAAGVYVQIKVSDKEPGNGD